MLLQSAYLTSILCLALLPASVTCGDAFPVGDLPRTDRYGNPLPDGAIFRVGTNRLRMKVEPPFGDVLLSGSGQFLVSNGIMDEGVRMWDTTTGREVHQFAAEVVYHTIALSADGSQLAVSDGNKIYLYDTATGNKQRTIDSPPLRARLKNPYSLYFSKDGKILTACIAAGSDRLNHIRRWETATGKKVEDRQTDAGTPLALSPDCGLMASMTKKDHTLRLWDVATRKKLREWKAVADVPQGNGCLTFSPDGRSLATADVDAMIRVYETDTGKEVRSWKGRSRNGQTNLLNHVVVGFLSFAPDSKSLASVDGDGILRLWDWTTGRELRHFENACGPVSFSADGKRMAAGGADCRIRLWDVATGRDLCPFADRDTIIKIDFSPDARVLYVGSDHPQVRLLDAATGRPLQSHPDFHFVAASPDGSSFLVRYKDESLRLLDATTGKERTRIHSTKDHALVGWDAQKKFLVTEDNCVFRVWDTTTGRMRCEIGGDNKFLPGFCSPDGRTVTVTETEDGKLRLLATDKIRLFATDSGKELRPLTGCTEDVVYDYERPGNSVGGRGLFPVFSANGKFLLAGCDRNSFGVWDVSSSERILRWKCSEFVPIGVRFSHDGKWLTLADAHGDPCLVDATTGRLRHRLAWKAWDGEMLRDLAFSADDRLLAVAYDKKTIILWETATGQPIRTWPGHGRGELRQMVFSSDSRRLATLGRDGTALVWDVTGLSPDGQLPAHKLTAAEMEQAWHDLASSDAVKAHRAIWSLVADPKRALTLCHERLHAIPEIDKRWLTQLMADLDSEDFKVRDTAVRELRKHGELARSALRESLTKRASLEVRRRVRGLLDELDSAKPSPESLRQIRVVAVLEHLSSEEARKLLGVLAGGSPEARQTQEAKASLARLRFSRLCSR